MARRTQRETQDADPEKLIHGRRLKPEDKALIFRLAAKGTTTQAEIARIVGCNESTVSRLLQLMDTRPEARVLLEAGAVKLAQTVVDTDDPSVALKALGKIDVVRDDRAEVPDTRIVVMLGGIEPPKMTLVALPEPAVDATVVSPALTA